MSRRRQYIISNQQGLISEGTHPHVDHDVKSGLGLRLDRVRVGLGLGLGLGLGGLCPSHSH